MKKEAYEKAELEIHVFEVEDIIAASNGGGGDINDPGSETPPPDDVPYGGDFY